MIENYCVIDTGLNVVDNVIVWDGVETWEPGAGHEAAVISECGIGDAVEESGGVWEKVV
jgi:hypothetical protein